MRNMTVNYRGGSYSRAGTAFVGYSKQTTRSYPPRVIQYQFSINQGLALEFGNFYMRVISNGAYVINPSYLIGGISNASPAVLTVNGLTVSAAAPINTNVTASYAPNDTITVAGGTYTTPAVLSVTTTTLLAVSPNAAGSGYAPADTITLSGGVASPSAVVTVATTQVSGLPTINAAGSGGAGSGAGVVQGTTGTGTKFQAAVTISGGAITAVTSLTLAGSYTVNPTTPAMEPVVWVSGAGSGLTGAKLAIALGVKTVTLTTAGVFTTNPNGLAFTQASSSGGGSGATFNSALFGVQALGVVTGGPYSTTPTNPASQLSTSGTGFGLQGSWGGQRPIYIDQCHRKSPRPSRVSPASGLRVLPESQDHEGMRSPWAQDPALKACYRALIVVPGDAHHPSPEWSGSEDSKRQEPAAPGHWR